MDIFEKFYEAIEKRFSHIVSYAENDAIACNECEHDNLSFESINHADNCVVLLLIKDVQTLEAAQPRVQADLACTCGSTEFYELSGSYYCNECGKAKPAKPLI